jgi:hypothetical protein
LDHRQQQSEHLTRRLHRDLSGADPDTETPNAEADLQAFDAEARDAEAWDSAARANENEAGHIRIAAGPDSNAEGAECDSNAEGTECESDAEAGTGSDRDRRELPGGKR